jgi:hypothetical protein
MRLSVHCDIIMKYAKGINLTFLLALGLILSDFDQAN